MSLIQEAREHVIHEIAPTLSPSVSGEFQVLVIGALNNEVELELRISDPENQEKVLHRFEVVKVRLGKTATLKGLTSTINFLPSKLT